MKISAFSAQSQYEASISRRGRWLMRSQKVAGDDDDDDDDDAVPRTDLEERESGRRESDVVGLEGYLFGGRRKERTSKQGRASEDVFLPRKDG
jgi:hypothetical protein